MTIKKTKFVVPAICLAMLTACGGSSSGGDSSSSGGNSGSGITVGTPSNSGTLTDSAIGGVAYTTSGGYSGTTDTDGHFLYNTGETVTFKIGDLTLGVVTPSGTSATITPIELATASGVTDTNKTTNLLVLLQSLDNDGDPSNGITIASAAVTALSGTGASLVDLMADPAVFAADPDLAGFVTQVNSAGGTAQVVGTTAAQNHFREEFMAKLSGTWVVSPNASEVTVIRFDANGNYSMGEYAPSDEDGHSGIERGLVAWAPTTGQLTASGITIDTNGQWGLSDPNGETLYVSLEGDNSLKITIKKSGEPDQVDVLSRLPKSGTGIVGTWVVNDGTSFDMQQFVFLEGNKYMMLDPLGDTEASQCGGPGMEYGSYSYASNTLSFSSNIVDTNGCAGAHDNGDDVYASFPATLDNGGTQLVTGDTENDPLTLYREGTASAR